MGARSIRLKQLLQQRHWQTYRTFCREYDRAANEFDPVLVGSWPSRAQLHRWQTGELKNLPYPDHCRVLEQMFQPWTADQLFEVGPIDLLPAATTSGDRAATAERSKVDAFPDMNEEDNRLIAQRIRAAKAIVFIAHTGYAVMVSQYQVAMRHAVRNGCKLRVVVSDPDGPLMQEESLTRRLCPSIRQAGEIKDVLDACRRHWAMATDQGLPDGNVQARVYEGVPSMNILLVDDWLRVLPYLPLLDAAESPVFEMQADQDRPSPLVAKFLISIERLWADARVVDLSATPMTTAPPQVNHERARAR